MKKLFSLILGLCLLAQLLSIPALAAETGDPTQPTQSLADSQAPIAAFGTASVLNGCRTLEGMVPLGGSDRMLDTAQAAFVYEQNTGTVLYAYNPDTSMSPGALTKILTAIVAIENGNLSDQVTISTANYSSLPAGARNSKLKHDEVMSLKDLLYCMILNMSNDAAISIAEHIAGSEDQFVLMMNELAKSIGCTGTIFTNCHGIDSAGQYTTARDLTRIIEYATKNSDFLELFGTKSYTVPATNKSEERDYTTLNYLLEQLNVTKYIYNEVTGGVATYTTSSGASIACMAKDEDTGISLIVVLLGAERKYTDDGIVESYGNFEEVWDLLDFGFDGYKICRLIHDGQSMSQFTVANGENHVVGQTSSSMDAVLPKDAHLDTLILKYSVADGGLTAPIQQGQMIATLQISYRGSCIAETELFAMSSVQSVEDSELDIQSNASRDDSNLTEILSFIGVIALIILVPFAIYLIYNNVRRAIARNRRRRRRRSRRRSR